MSNLLRDVAYELAIDTMLSRESASDTLLEYFNRVDDMDQVASEIKTRYGYGIKLVQDPNSTGASYETYAKEQFHTLVESGLTDVVTIGFGQKIINAVATMFTESGQKFSLVLEGTENLEKAEDLLNLNRKQGGFHTAVTRADERSVQLGTAAIFPVWNRKYINYQVLSPGDVRAFYAESGVIQDEKNWRSVDKTDLEDATVVIIRLGEVDLDTWNYLAIFGASEDYPEGRWVTYKASSYSTEVPKRGAEGTYDYEINGVPCNPLTYYANRNPDLDLPEYPIAIIDGGVTQSTTEVMPISQSLYTCSLKFDEKASRLLSTSSDAARGLTIFERSEVGKTAVLPRTNVGSIVTQPGVTARHESLDSKASVDGWEVLQKEMVSAASGFGGVPDFMVVSDDYTLDAASGIALQVKTRPLKKFREKRIELNRAAVRKLFTIEKALISLHAEADAGAVALLEQCEQTWDPGELRLPQNKVEVSEYLSKLGPKGEGVMDTIAQIKEWYQLPTDEEAIEVYEKMRDRAEEFPPLVKEPEPQKQTFGLRNRANNQLQAVK